MTRVYKGTDHLADILYQDTHIHSVTCETVLNMWEYPIHSMETSKAFPSARQPNLQLRLDVRKVEKGRRSETGQKQQCCLFCKSHQSKSLLLPFLCYSPCKSFDLLRKESEIHSFLGEREKKGIHSSMVFWDLSLLRL